MIFILAENEPVLFVMFVESDIAEMRRGLTKFVDKRHLQGKKFERVVCSLHKNKDEIMKLVNSLPGGPEAGGKFVQAGAVEGETVCGCCKGTVPAGSTFEGNCIVCWAAQAKAGRAAGIIIKPV